MAFVDKIGLALQNLQGSDNVRNYSTFAGINFDDFAKLVKKDNSQLSGLFPKGEIVGTSIDEKTRLEDSSKYKVLRFSVASEGITYNKELPLLISDSDWENLNSQIENIKKADEKTQPTMVSNFKDMLRKNLSFEIREDKDSTTRSLRVAYQNRNTIFSF